jgi:hypothetical protein
MANEYLSTYLNDHLAGAAAAIEFLERLESVHADKELAQFFSDLRSDIEADRRELQNLMRGLQIKESPLRAAGAWIGEKVTALKLRVDDHARGPLGLLESLEVVALGIDGKLSLWRALNAVAGIAAAVQGVVDLELLTLRAEEQRWRVEVVRLESAKAAFARAGTSEPSDRRNATGPLKR